MNHEKVHSRLCMGFCHLSKSRCYRDKSGKLGVVALTPEGVVWLLLSTETAHSDRWCSSWDVLVIVVKYSTSWSARGAAGWGSVDSSVVR